MPVGGLLELMGDVEQLCLGEVGAENLQADGAVAAKPAGTLIPGMPARFTAMV